MPFLRLKNHKNLSYSKKAERALPNKYKHFTKQKSKLGKKFIKTTGLMHQPNIYFFQLSKIFNIFLVNDLGGDRHGTSASTSMADKVVNEIKTAGGQAVANYG